MFKNKKDKRTKIKHLSETDYYQLDAINRGY
jgi:hypothetical protein